MAQTITTLNREEWLKVFYRPGYVCGVSCRENLPTEYHYTYHGHTPKIPPSRQESKAIDAPVVPTACPSCQGEKIQLDRVDLIWDCKECKHWWMDERAVD